MSTHSGPSPHIIGAFSETGRTPVVQPVFIGETAETILDTARLIGIARETAGQPLDPTWTLSANLRRTSDGDAYWVIRWANAEGRPIVSIIIDSKTGAARKQPG